LERNGAGLNLTREGRDGIANHQVSTTPMTLEGRIVRICDKIAYVNHDIDDAIRGHIIKEEEIPTEFTDVLGHSLSERLNTLIHDIIMNSEDKNDIVMSAHMEEAFQGLRAYMFKSVYTNPVAKGQESKAEQMVKELYQYYMDHAELLPREAHIMMEEQGEPLERVVCDYVAGMTDRYAVAKFKDITIPTAWDIF